MASRRRHLRPPNLWAALSTQTKFLIDCQSVMALRLIKLSKGGKGAARESVAMIHEKFVTLAESQVAVAVALRKRGVVGAVVAGAQPYRRAVARNRRRLSG